ncbi:LacI family transcriptional regulator [Bifidobacterium saguini DSM 23967]|uniref:LacI family transcriptional regulator n=2 Tax=Bifidobacterium saguini TaxID=762210 RepID=A0A087DB67_9BIFI|nr:substrate-binding domain-containing protein [Bifidobacterium saguini]KFI92767.1 LacI family transcriptional regulator [Bifidobacterium saguini DSM 23967]QTB91773.1 substrate-binding domain-containing protein [Bifidobacterium saguini]
MPRTKRGTAPSIRDVAAVANVSVPTMSRYLKDPSRVSEKKRVAIAAAIEKLNYRPNPIARALALDMSESIAVMSADTRLYGRTQTFYGIERKAQEIGYPTTIYVLDSRGGDWMLGSVRSCLDRSPAGVILIDYDRLTDSVVSHIPSTTPLVIIGGPRHEDRAQIHLCEYDSAYAMTKHLLALGHATVHYVAVPSDVDAREDGWRMALSDAHVPAPAPIATTWDAEKAIAIGQQLGEDDSVTAIFAGNDEIAMGVMRGLAIAGKRVPEDVIVAGFDDHTLSRVWNPPLTTIRQHFDEAGEHAVTMLKQQIDDVVNNRPRGEAWTMFDKIAGELVKRESTGELARAAVEER